MYISECYTECLTNNVVGDIQVHGVDFRSLEGHLASRNQTGLVENPLSLTMFLASPTPKNVF